MQENKVRVVFEAVLSKFNKNIKSATKTTLQLGDAGEKASEKVNFDKANRSVNFFENNLKKLQSTLKTLIVGYAGKKLFDMGKNNLKYFAEYQQSMAEVFTLLPELSGQAREKMLADVKQFAKDMKILPEEVVPALYQAISASVPKDEVFGFLKIARMASKGGITDLETSVDVLTSIVNAYGKEVINATEASDLMFMAKNKGKTTFGEMASNMYHVLPIAKALKVPFENVTAAISTITAMGTPTAQATTQIGRMFAELSKEGTKTSTIFKKVTKKTFKEFIAEGNNVQDALNIMEEVAQKLGIEINDLFTSIEGGQAALALTGEGAQKFNKDLVAMKNSAGSTKQAYEEMNSTISSMIEGIKAKISVFKIEIAEGYFPEIEDAIKKVDETFDRLEQNGSLDRLAQSIGNIVATIILEFDKILNNIDSIIDKINRLAYFIQNNLPTAIKVVKKLAKAFLFFKAAAAVSHVIKAVAGAIELLTGAQWALNVAQKANPIGIIITLIGLLLLWIFKLIGGFENLKTIGVIALEGVKIAFLYLAKAIVWGVDIILQALAKLLGWIPGIGDAFKAAADASSKVLEGLRSEINDTIAKIGELNNKEIKTPYLEGGNSGLSSSYRYGLPKDSGTGGFAGYTPNSKTSNVNIEELLVEESKDGSGGSEKAPKTIHDRIRDVEDRHKPDIDLYESRAKLAETKEDTKVAKANKNLLVEMFRKQASDLLRLQQSSKGQNAKIVEAARNKVLTKIEETLRDINDGVSKMVGDFNTPSELRAMTEYQYKVEKADNKLSKRLVYSPNVQMYLTLKDTGKKGVKQVKEEMSGFTNAIFEDKNDLVTKFIQDVTRN